MKNRKPEIELIRTIACLLVIMAHGQLLAIDGDTLYRGRLIYAAIIPDNVLLFFMITGFFFFTNVNSLSDIPKAYCHKIKKFITGIYLPTIVLILFSMLFNHFDNRITTHLGISYDLKYLTDFVFHFESNDHLWYIIAHMQLVVLFPLLALLCQKNILSITARRIILLSSFALFVFTDYEYYHQMHLYDENGFELVYYIFYLLIGYELSQFLTRYQSKYRYLLIAGITMYIPAYLAKCYLHIQMFYQYGINDSRFKWKETCLSVFTSIGLFLIIYSFKNRLLLHTKLCSFITWFGSKTFYIYLIHKLVTNELRAIGYRDFILSLNHGGNRFIYCLPYYIEFDSTVIIISLSIAVLVTFIIDRIKLIIQQSCA